MKLSKGYSERGSNMGRADLVENEGPVKLHLYRMVMSPCRAYDKGGAYWGCGSLEHGWMFHAYSDDGTVSVFVRAINWEAAKAAVLELVEECTFLK